MIFVFFGVSYKVYGLIPLESVLLGDLSNQFKTEDIDPLSYIFKMDIEGGTKIQYKRLMANYRGFSQEGENLARFCQVKYNTDYNLTFERDEVKRSMLANLQYLGLDLISHALPAYAKALNFKEEDFNHLATGLVKNFCSENISIISKKELIKNLNFIFTSNNDFDLPVVKNNPFFPQAIYSSEDNNDYLKKEFLATIDMFKGFCGWGAEVNDVRLMVPYVKNPAIMSFVIRQMTNKKIVWESISNGLSLEEDENTIQVLCEGLICRKTDKVNFNRSIPRMLGTSNIEEDLKRLYCDDFRHSDYKRKDLPKTQLSLMNEMTLQKEAQLSGQFLALATGIPELTFRVGNTSELKDFLRKNLDEMWLKWSDLEIDKKDNNFYLEEPITVELVDRNLYFNYLKPKFKVVFDVNLGEFDRGTQMVGKLGVKFDVKVMKSFLAYVREFWDSDEVLNDEKRNHLINVFRKKIINKVEKSRSKFQLPPWDGPLENLIVKELIDQLKLYKGSYFNQSKHELVTIPIELNYGTFALKYIYYQRSVKKYMGRLDKMNSLFNTSEKSN